jgi:hypothetical protein
MFGFSPAGLIVSLLILAPSLLLLVWPAHGQPRPVPSAGRILSIAERAGQVGCLTLPAITGSEPTTDWLLVGIIVCVAVFYALWLRYLLTGRRSSMLYRHLGPIPVPMAVFPVLAFLALAGWLASWWVLGAAVVLATGHLATAWTIRRSLPTEA